MNLSDKINSAEKLYLGPVELFFTGIFHEYYLSSHGIDHHRRVWNYAKELLHYIKEEEQYRDPLFITKLLIACYLHDIGMSIDPGIRHGHHSRKLCEQFLLKNKLNKSDFTDVLEAIENHDNKEYSETSERNQLLTLLSVADDLDAFGFIGILRYAEIYLKRRVSYQEIGHLIRENARKRFENFVSVFNKFPNLVKKYEQKYLILDDFYEKYNLNICNYTFSTGFQSGQCGIIEIISDASNKRISLKDMIPKHRYSSDKFINDFFESLLQE